MGGKGGRGESKMRCEDRVLKKRRRTVWEGRLKMRGNETRMVDFSFIVDLPISEVPGGNEQMGIDVEVRDENRGNDINESRAKRIMNCSKFKIQS